MTNDVQAAQRRRFVAVILPRIIAGAGLLIYLLTLNHWVTFFSLGHVARASGFTWQAELTGPVYWLVTYPFRWLPTTWIPVALNVLSALWASLTLGLLARSVALLPHDRTQEQRDRERSSLSVMTLKWAWFPPVFACLLCGLQLTFWENATVASGEVFDLLLFAYILRCLLEYRIEERDSWLHRAALVYGMAMTNNWAMVGFFPIFLVSLVWLKGFSFFNASFLSRMLGFGSIGLLFYLLLPLVHAIGDTMQVGFWQALKFNLVGQKNFLRTLVFNKFALFLGDKPLWVLSLPSLLPLLILSIRWPGYFGDFSRIGILFTTWILNFFHAVLLGLCIWICLDPLVSPRNYVPGFLESGLLLLPFYYLSALCAAYYSGYFLIVFAGKLPSKFMRPIKDYPVFVKKAVLAVFWLGCTAAVCLLVYRNLPQILTTNGSMYRRFAALLQDSLPKKPALLLSDDPRRSLLLKEALLRNPNAGQYILLDTAGLKWPDYHNFLARTYKSKWTPIQQNDRRPMDDLSVLQIIAGHAKTNEVFYLHPSFGYYFELFYAEPHGLTYRFLRYPTNVITVPDLPQPLITENNAFWKRAEEVLLPQVASGVSQTARPGFLSALFERLHLPQSPNKDSVAIGAALSRALDTWGVELQRQDQFEPAAQYFKRAIDLKPDNVVAQVNLEYNRNRLAGKRAQGQVSKPIEDQFARYRNWDQVMTDNGPFDEPVFCYEQGQVFSRAMLLRQAAQQFARVTELQPENLLARLWLAQIYVRGGMPEKALEITKLINEKPQDFGLTRSNMVELLSVETAAHLARKDTDAAVAVVRKTLREYPKDDELLLASVQVFMSMGAYTNALAFIDQQLALQPRNGPALVNKGFALLQTGRAKEAIAPLTTVINMKSEVPRELYTLALMNRAIAELKSSDLDASKRDYETLQRDFPKDHRLSFGLGEIAYRQKDTNNAIKHYQLYLTNAPRNTLEYKTVTERVGELQGKGG